jgi:hypothetical protein
MDDVTAAHDEALARERVAQQTGMQTLTPADQPVRLLNCSRASATGFLSRRLRPTGGGSMTCHPLRLRASTTT